MVRSKGAPKVTTADDADQWYWCVRHGRAEHGEGCRADDRLGPYESKSAAEHWRDRAEARDQLWEEQDRAWGDEAD